MEQVKHFIGGKFISAGGKPIPIHNPADGEAVAECCCADADVVAQAVASAEQAYPAWSKTSPIKRAQVLFRYRELLIQHRDELAALVTREHGKVLADATGSVQRGIELLEYACSIPNLLQGKMSENVANEVDCYTVRQSLGVCVGISPFNFPVMVPVWQFVWAIACGNTFILKPSEKDPSITNRLAELLQEAGLPDGVFNIVHGDKVAVDALMTHPSVRAVTAVASTPVAKSIYETAILHGKRAHTFGGAKNHMVVMPDAPLEETANALVSAAYGSAGERCMAISAAVVIGDEMADKLVASVKEKAQALKVGNGSQEGIEMGPLSSGEHRERVLGIVNEGVEEGAELLLDGRALKISGHEQGYFVGPCLFDKVTTSMSVYQKEIFGPVLVVLRVNTMDEAIQMINDNQYGNGTAIFTQDGQAARKFAHDIQVGMVGINIPIPVPIAHHTFGGWKDSVFGDVAMHGDQSIQFYTKIKSVTTRWLHTSEGANLMMPTH